MVAESKTESKTGRETEEKTERKIEAIYPYKDENGNLLYEAVRFSPKGFCFRRPDGKGGWIYNLEGVRKVPYRLQELLAAHPDEEVYIPEGEKDVERIVAEGFIAICNPGGAGKWLPEFSELLRGRLVRIPQDNDDAGKRHARMVAESVCGIAKSIRILDLTRVYPGLPVKGDISDLFDAGFKRGHLSELVDITPEFKSEKDKSGLVVIDMADVEGKKVEWLWLNRFPQGMLSIVLGEPGLGKSYVTLSMAATVSQGRPWPDGSPCLKGQVLIFCTEDSLEHTVKPRLQALVANTETSMIRVIAAARDIDENGNEVQDSFLITKHLSRLEAMLRANPDIRMVIIDPLSAYFGSTDTHVDAKVRSALAPLSQIADRHKVAVICVMHPNKGRSANILHRISGSGAFGAIVRSMWFVCADPADETNNRRFMLNAKMNIAEKSPGLAFEIGKDGPVFEPDPIDMTPEDVIGKPSNVESPRLDEAVEFLKEALSEGPVASKELEKTAKEAGISKDTLRRAKDQIGVKARQEFDEQGNNYWAWQLPTKSEPPKQMKQINDYMERVRKANPQIFGKKPA